MIFRKDEAQKIRAGRKTMLLAAVHRDPLTGQPRPPRRWPVGEDFGVQPKAKSSEEPLCRIVITGHALTTLGALDFHAARALGHRTQAEMAADWMLIYDPQWPPLEEAICETCDGHAELDGGPCPDRECEYGVVMAPPLLEDEDVLATFRSRHGHRQVWAVTFELATDLPRLLVAQVSDSSPGSYTSKGGSALAGEPEAVDEVTQSRLTKEARSRDDARKARRLSERLADLEGDPSVRRQLAAIERRLTAAELVRNRRTWAA